VDAGFLDMLHDAADEHFLAVAEGIDIDLGGVLEKAVNEHGTFLRVDDGLPHVAVDGSFVVGDDHGASAEDVAGTDQDRVADLAGDLTSFGGTGGGVVFGLRDVQFGEQGAEALAVFRKVDRLGVVDRVLSVKDVLRRRLFPSRIRLPERLKTYYRRATVTRMIPNGRSHRLRYAD
jgi:hypothetical protein